MPLKGLENLDPDVSVMLCALPGAVSHAKQHLIFSPSGEPGVIVLGPGSVHVFI